MLFREEWRRSRQGKKVPEGRCGKTIEAKPLSGQTCLIEPAEGSAANNEGKEHGDGYPHAVRARLFERLMGETAQNATRTAADTSI